MTGQLIRQIGVVIGLTVILTFPVTVISGAGFQKEPDRVVRLTATSGKGQRQMGGKSAMGGAKTDKDANEPGRRVRRGGDDR